ncbi:MAG: glycosyltransferase [Proteobacteria bacterium]|nr:glycosyltransferase [Pseudomonadota bacterium]
MSTSYPILLFIPNLQQGGAERQILELMTRLPDRFAPTLCVYEDTTHYAEYLPSGEPRYNLRVRKMGPVGLSRLVRVLREVRPAILHSYREKANMWARLAAMLEPVPIVVVSFRNRAIHPIHLVSEPVLSRVSDRVLTNSIGIKHELVRFARVAPEKIQIIHNFIDLDKFQPATGEQRARARARYGLSDDDVALLLPGRISLQKHQLGLIVSLHHLVRRGLLRQNIRVLLAGRERDRWVVGLLPRLMSLLDVDRNTERLGPIDDMVGLYHAADALVMPSLFEGLPNAVLEAHACGLPAVVSHAANVDGLVIDGESGFEVPTFAHRAFAEAIARIVALPREKRRQMGLHGRQHIATHFSVDRVLGETTELYDTLLAEKGLA